MDRYRFVLVEPKTSGNVGASARALANLGFRRLELVAPACEHRNQEATRMAVDAVDVLLGARVHATLDEALAGASTVIGTSRRVGKQRQPHFRLDEMAPELPRFAQAGEIAFLFGREADGLEHAELDRCTHLVHFLSDEAYPSFNLAQSVLLVAYETRKAMAGPPPPAMESIADDETREAMYRHLDAALRAVGFLQDETSEGMMRRLRRILGRAELSPGDVKVVRGIARRMLWLAGRESAK